MGIAICDDDKNCRTQLLTYLNEYIAARNCEITISVYEHSSNLLDDLTKLNGFDIYLLDIIMPGMNGIELGKWLHQSDPNAKIIYLTSSTEYALEAFKARAFDYLIKPVKKESLFATLDDLFSVLSNKKEKSFLVKTKENTLKLPFDSIMYAELNRKTIHYYLSNSKVIESSTIRTAFSDAVQSLLQDSRFVLCGSGIVVNLYYIIMVETDTIHFKNGSKLYIGKRASRDLRSVWSDFWLNEEDAR